MSGWPRPPTAWQKVSDVERLPIVIATGEAVREVPPEQAVIHVRAETKGRSRETVLERLAERSAAHAAILDEFSAAIERRENEGVNVYPQTRRRGEDTYHGSVGTRVLVTDFTVLGDLILRLGAEEMTALSGPWWQLRPGSRAGGEARQAAVTDALTRAAEYASAVGARVDRLVEISDVLSSDGGHMAFAAGAMARDAGPELQLEPALQTVRVQVKVTVTISEPTLPI